MTDSERSLHPDRDDSADELPPGSPAEGVVDEDEPDPPEPQEPG